MKKKLSIIAFCAALPCTVLLLIAAGGREARQSDAGQTITANTSEPHASGGELTPATGKALVGIGRGADHAAVTTGNRKVRPPDESAAAADTALPGNFLEQFFLPVASFCFFYDFQT
jgi:hypothetical protein